MQPEHATPAAGELAPAGSQPARVRARAADLSAPAPAVPVAVADVRKVYDSAGHQVIALDGVSLTIEQGSFTAIMGASGSGKSTLMHLIGGLTRPTSGRILVEGHNLGAMTDHKRTLFRRRRLGIIFQEYNLLPTLTAAENVALPLLLDGRPLSDYLARVAELLTTVHLEHRMHHRPDALSGGEQQRVAIARALLNDPAIVLADEPTGNLDSKQSIEIWRLMQRIAREQNKTIVMVTHEAPGAAHADRVVILKDGKVVGTLEPKGSGDAALVATGYQELAG
ncbi:Lipoprotein-releasing system ATP-binding protein LolD [Phycisphaerae bacterium RAS1]|nr:Lipoprotein-releasing system ATP-binding protein LolD [Phycisphaerae bacterium RAS1]